MAAEYLLLLLALFAITIVVDWKYHIKIYNSWKERIIILLMFFILGVPIDNFATYRGWWSFGETGLVGISIGLIPIEEYLFVLIVPYFIITFYKVFKKEI